jgi:molecular chaperone HtpG
MDERHDEQSESTHPINLHVPGILKLLSEHLYSDPKVALRELIQNAHDSCQRRLAEDPDYGDRNPRIDIHIDQERHQFVIRDNGSGLTESEIHDYLATIGRGYTSELRERLQFSSRGEALALIGQFGLGLLSAFIVAGRIEMVTRSYQPGEPAWRWVSTGEETYTLAKTSRPSPGSTFTLNLKLEGYFLLNDDIVREGIRTYADFLTVPIYLNDGEEPVNAIDAPWHLPEASLEDYQRFVAERFGARAPLTVLPLHDHVEPVGDNDELVMPLAGVLFVPTGSIMSVREYGDVAVYIRRMFITSEDRDLLPRWARFVRGVVDSPVLRPTVSREQVRRDETFFQVQSAIEAQLLAHLQDLAQNDPAAWRNIVVAHNDLIKGWALESRTFFDAVCDLVTFETSRGRLPLQEYLGQTGDDIYYFVEERGSTQEKMLYEARGLTVIDASRFAEEAFLQAYARTHPRIQLRQLAPGAAFVFGDVDDPEGRWTPITRYYAEQGILTRVVSFEPKDIPAMLIYPPGSDHIAETRAALDGGEISGPIAGLVAAYLAMRDPMRTGTQGTLHINASNPLMRRVLTLPPENEAFTATLEIVYHNARFFAGRTLTAQEAKLGFEMISYSVEQLVRSVALATFPGAAGPLRPETLIRLGLQEDIAGRICARCPTVAAFLHADATILAKWVGGAGPLIEAAQQTLRDEYSDPNRQSQ